MKVFMSLFTIFFILITVVMTNKAFAGSPVVVELFSSQACPACPPADRFLGQLSKQKNIIAFSCHVDYFGNSGSILGKKFCTQRQSKYIKQIKRRSHYTPQMMVNGHMDVIGYETQNVIQKIATAREEQTKEIQITPNTNGVYSFALPQLNMHDEASLLMVIYQKPRTFKYRGQKTTYYNVVSHILPLGVWKGTKVNKVAFPLFNDKSRGFAIIAQNNKTGHIIAAGDYKLP